MKQGTAALRVFAVRYKGDQIMLAQTVRRQALAVVIMAVCATVLGATTGYGQKAIVLADTTTPHVYSTNPDNNASGVFINRKIAVSFNEAMDPATLTPATFTLQKGITPVSGAVTYSEVGHVAFFAPDSLLDTLTDYSAKLITAVTDTAGNSLANDYVWNFSTGEVLDTIRPTVIVTFPDTNATGVSVYAAISATFTETVDPSTFTTSSVMQGFTPVPGTLTYDMVVGEITFTPDSNLLFNTVYTVTLSTGITDLAGNALDADYVWSFTTGTASIREPVDLGTAGNFVILAKTGVSTTGTTSVVGDIGLSPAAATYITGFDLILDPSGTFSTSALVDGQIFAASYTEPTPTMLTTAVGDMETAYTTAAGLTLPDYTELHAGDLTGKTLVRGLYKWSSGVMINAPGVTLTGDSNDVWIFQIAQTLLVGNGAIVTLSGGALPKNIFWQVAGQTTLGTTTQFKGNILDQTAIVMQTGSSLNGRALAQSAVTLDATSATIPTGVELPMEGTLAFDKMQLLPCRPNPASGAVNISYVLPRSGNVSLVVYDVCGRVVKTLARGHQQGGTHNLTWRGDDSRGRLLPASVYFYRLGYEGTSLTRRVVLLR